MALLGQVTVSGVVVDDAYVRVEPIALNKGRVAFRREVFATSEDPARPGVRVPNTDAGPLRVEECVCDYDLDGPNPWVQAYGHLKTQPEFAEASDYNPELTEVAA